MYPRFPLAVSALLLLTAFPTHAADPSEDRIVVTATRQAARANELLSDVSVIGRETIDSSPAENLGDLLGREVGIQFSQSGSPGSAQSLFIRGANAEHTLVLIDGQRFNSATLGTTSLSRIPLEQIERIEILRGPASSLYGADALGGVIQIFTRKGNGPARANAEVAVGSDHARRASAGFSGSHENWRYSLQLAQESTDGFSTVRAPTNGAYNADRDGFRNQSVSGSLGYRFSADHEAGASFLYSDGRNEYDGGYNRSSAAHDYRNDLWVASGSAYVRSRLTPNWTSTLRVGRGIDDAEYLTDKVRDSAVRTTQDQFVWQNDVKLPLGSLLLALEHLDQSISTRSAYDRNERTIDSALVGWSASAGRHRWQLNLRSDDISGAARKTTGTAAYGFRLTDEWRTTASIGTAYKAPSMNDLYFPDTPYVGRGNPDLKPESARNVEAALHYDSARYTASLTVFDNHIDDLIQWAELPAGSWFYVPQNVASARIKGVSLAVAGRFDALTLRANLNGLDARDQTTGNRLPRRARVSGTLAADYDTGPWTLGGELIAHGARFSDTANTQRLGGFALMNLTASYRLDHDFSLFARLTNVFDKHYALVADYGTAGRAILVGLRYQPR